MNIKQLKAHIEEIKAKGDMEISCDTIIAYLNNVEDSSYAEPSAIELERYKADLQNNTEKLKHEYEVTRENNKATITAGQNAIRSSFLMNGGGAVALLAFITHLAQFKPERVPELAVCLLPFVGGVLTTTVTSGIAYYVQWSYADGAKFSTGDRRFVISCISFFALISYALFVIGILSTYYAFQNY